MVTMRLCQDHCRRGKDNFPFLCPVVSVKSLPFCIPFTVLPSDAPRVISILALREIFNVVNSNNQSCISQCTLIAFQPSYTLISVVFFLFLLLSCRVDQLRSPNQIKSHPSDHLLKVVYNTFSTVMALQQDQNKSRRLRFLKFKTGVKAKRKKSTIPIVCAVFFHCFTADLDCVFSMQCQIYCLVVYMFVL